MKNSSNSYRKIKNKNYSIAQVILKSSLLLIIMVMSSCRNGGDEDLPTNKELIVGKWEVTSGEFLLDNSKYVFVNENNTIEVLSEDELGFKSKYSTHSTITDDQITIAGEGLFIINFTLINDKLSLQSPDGDTTSLIRATNPPELDTWIKTLTVLDEGNAPWQRDVDITFDGTYILGGDILENKIFKVNPTTFDVEGSIPTTMTAYAVEIEKSDHSLKQIFQSNGGTAKFTSFFYVTGSKYYESIELGSSRIKGIASIEPGYVWVSSFNARTLYKYKSNGALSPGQVMQTVPLEFLPSGLDYQNGYLYVTEDNMIHKCQTSPNFKAIESYQLPNQGISGVAFDGSNFWLSTENWDENKQKLVKIDL